MRKLAINILLGLTIFVFIGLIVLIVLQGNFCSDCVLSGEQRILGWLFLLLSVSVGFLKYFWEELS